MGSQQVPTNSNGLANVPGFTLGCHGLQTYLGCRGMRSPSAPRHRIGTEISRVHGPLCTPDSIAQSTPPLPSGSHPQCGTTAALIIACNAPRAKHCPGNTECAAEFCFAENAHLYMPNTTPTMQHMDCECRLRRSPSSTMQITQQMCNKWCGANSTALNSSGVA